jgi:transcriptional regulator NrdR family protein
MSACIGCGEWTTVVIETEPWEFGYRFRRRKCVECGARWNTLEVPKDTLEITPHQDEGEAADADDA